MKEMRKQETEAAGPTTLGDLIRQAQENKSE